MPVRRPRSKLQKRKGGKSSVTNRVKGIRSDAAWDSAMRKSNKCYLVVAIYGVRIPSLPKPRALCRSRAT